MIKALHIFSVALIAIGSFILGLYFFAFTNGTSDISFPPLVFAVLSILLGTSLLLIRR